MAKTENELFDGEPVIEFESQKDRRNFLRSAAKIGVGGALAMVGVACADDGDETSPEAAQTPDEAEETIDNNESPEGPAVPQG
ncbi:MAG: hypothetical protein M3345_05690, partial [Actinomycetota bacterium]|nr:hypothetical protein [Actinomycetota bacterium]